MFHPLLKTSTLAAALACAAFCAHAQTPDCAALAAKAAPGMTLKTEAIAADVVRAPGATPATPPGPLLAAHCLQLYTPVSAAAAAAANT
jgi:hypothetical protein